MTDAPRLPLTADEFANIPAPEGTRLELWEGNLVMMAAAQKGWHSAIVDRITYLFREAKRTTLREVGVVLGPRDVPIPDVVVFRGPVDLERSQYPVRDVTCVVEVISPESVNRDKNAKPAKYAAARIPEFWLVARLPEDPEDAQVEIYRLTPDQDSYVLTERNLLSDLEQR